MNFICPGQPGLRVLAPVCNPDARRAIPPRAGINVLEPAIMEPQRGPLYLHALGLIVEDGIHVLDGVMEAVRWCDQFVVVDIG